MKEAAGEANMTVITIVLIAIVLAIGTIVVNSLMSGVQKKSNCSNYGGTWYNGSCCTSPKTDTSGKVTGCDGTTTCGTGDQAC